MFLTVYWYFQKNLAPRPTVDHWRGEQPYLWYGYHSATNMSESKATGNFKNCATSEFKSAAFGSLI